jgi:LysR family transcriptional regulator, regulator for bpeEF and oprC
MNPLPEELLMDRFDAMRAFAQVVECGSFTRAAHQLGLHKATVSQQIQLLEERVGARLLTRTTRAVAPTVDGHAYYRKVTGILQQVDEAESALRTGAHAPAGRLRVDVPVAIGRLLLVPEVRHFLEHYPAITLELGCTDRVVDLVREGVDCALRGGHLPDSGLAARKVGDLQFVLCAAPRYIDAHGLPVDPQALAAHFQVGYLPAGAAQARPVQLLRDGAALAVLPKARFVTTDSGAVLQAGLDGVGIIQVADFVASHHLASGALVRVLPGWQCPAMPLHLVTPTARRRAVRVQAFMDWAHGLLARRLAAHMVVRP